MIAAYAASWGWTGDSGETKVETLKAVGDSVGKRKKRIAIRRDLTANDQHTCFY